MSTTSTTTQAAAPKQPQSRPLSSKVYKNTFVRSLRSEIRKMTSLRSTWLTLGLWLGLGILITWAMAATLADGQNNVGGINVHGEFHPVFITGSAQLYYIFAMVLGALAVTGEYASNTMRTTIVSQTSRRKAFASKIAAVTTVMGIATAAIISVLVAVTLLAGGLSWNGDDGNLRALLLFWLACVLTALMVTGAGYILRSTAGSIVTGVMVLLVSEMLRLVPVKFFQKTLPKFLPSGVTSGMTVSDTANPKQTTNYLSPGTAALVWLVYISVFVVLGAIRYQRSDA